MSRNENSELEYLRDSATATGEIVSVTADAITVGGIFTPGLGTYDLRPGARVLILNEDDAIASLSRDVDQ